MQKLKSPWFVVRSTAVVPDPKNRHQQNSSSHSNTVTQGTTPVPQSESATVSVNPCQRSAVHPGRPPARPHPSTVHASPSQSQSQSAVQWFCRATTVNFRRQRRSTPDRNTSQEHRTKAPESGRNSWRPVESRVQTKDWHDWHDWQAHTWPDRRRATGWNAP